MEDILALYTQPEADAPPLLCMDETSRQLVKETRRLIPAAPGRPRRYDYEYERNGVCNLFMFYAPFQGWRHVVVTDQRTQADWAWQLKELLDSYYAHAPKITLVMDNLNTHAGASFYATFAPSEARSLCQRFDIHYTPKHGSWLNMAEIELAVLTRQCLARRIPDKQSLSREVAAWEQQRNALEATTDWRFTTADARIKLKRLYPTLST